MEFNCWVCDDSLNNYMMLPFEEDYFEEEINIFKQSMVIKDVSPFKFLYFTCCNICIDNLIRIKYSSKNVISYIKNREHGIK